MAHTSKVTHSHAWHPFTARQDTSMDGFELQLLSASHLSEGSACDMGSLVLKADSQERVRASPACRSYRELWMMGVMPSEGVMVLSRRLEPTPPLTELSALYPSLFVVTCGTG